MEEIGVDFRLDETHYIEYSREILIKELQQASLHPHSIEVCWGEIWCEAHTILNEIDQVFGASVGHSLV
jgi:hypothetical protein